MAEATVERQPSTFFCHQCMREVPINIPAYTCSRCNSGFIEELESRAPPTSSTDARSSDPGASFAEVFPAFFGHTGTHRHRYNTRSAIQNSESDMDQSDEEEMRGIGPSAVFHFNADPTPTLPSIINYVIQRLGTDLGARNPVILHGNPGDYAWGAGGLDAIISQLLNHLEGTGAPPAQKEKIENLEKVRIDKTHVENTLQCSICMDDFELDVEVRKLPCDHMYHSECIIKWLEMHGTCPVCRKDLNGLDTSRNEDAVDTTMYSPSNDEGSGGHHGAPSSSSSSTSNGPSTSSSFLNLLHTHGKAFASIQY